MKKGIESLKAAVMIDCASGENCFNEKGCNKVAYEHLPEENPRLLALGVKTKCVRKIKCFHIYCEKYKWIMERAEHYATVLGRTKEQVIESWEEDRTYWYMNYYQDIKQPMLEGVKIFDTIEQAKQSMQEKGFRCPKCNGVSKSGYECSCEGCDWKAYGLFNTLGKGADIYIKEVHKLTHTFMPIAWEQNYEQS